MPSEWRGGGDDPAVRAAWQKEMDLLRARSSELQLEAMTQVAALQLLAQQYSTLIEGQINTEIAVPTAQAKLSRHDLRAQILMFEELSQTTLATNSSHFLVPPPSSFFATRLL